MAAWRRERRVLQRVSRAARRLEQAGRERAWALASARAEGVSIRTLAAAAGLVSARVHQITAGAPCGRDRGDRVDAAWSSSRRGVLSDGTPVIIRGDIDGAVRAWRTGDAPRSFLRCTDVNRYRPLSFIHSDVIITGAGADIVVHKPTLPRPTRWLPFVSGNKRPAGETTDNGRLSGTSVGEPLARTLAVTESEHPPERNNRTFGA
jgi:hypothetical protein